MMKCLGGGSVFIPWAGHSVVPLDFKLVSFGSRKLRLITSLMIYSLLITLVHILQILELDIGQLGLVL